MFSRKLETVVKMQLLVKGGGVVCLGFCNSSQIPREAPILVHRLLKKVPL